MIASEWARRLPWSILALAVPLVLAGWLGLARCEELSGGSGRVLRQQMVWTSLAVVAMLMMTVPSYRVLCRWTYPIFAISLALLVLVYFFPAINGARRWIRLGPIGFQPSEFAKIAFVLALARYLMYRDNYRRLLGLLAPLGIAVLPILLILREPDLGTALVFLPVLFLMLFVAGARRVDLGCLILVGVMGIPLLWSQMSLEQKSRVTALLEQPGPGEIVDADSYHLYQAKQMSALGAGCGSLALGQTVEDNGAYRLPHARTDFILCVLTERLGLPGVAGVLGLYVLLAWRGVAVAQATREPFGRLVASGLVGLLCVQVLINTGMTVGLLPITGLSLPLVSYGGSGMLAQGLVLGLLLNIGMRPGYEVAEEPFRYVVGRRVEN
jgi:cell division protein FtsW (lipid II flippase)